MLLHKKLEVNTVTAQIPLHGSELVDCARANAKLGVKKAAHYCGYDNQLDEFRRELKNACHQMGLDIDTIGELFFTDSNPEAHEIAPESRNQI